MTTVAAVIRDVSALWSPAYGAPEGTEGRKAGGRGGEKYLCALLQNFCIFLQLQEKNDVRQKPRRGLWSPPLCTSSRKQTWAVELSPPAAPRVIAWNNNTITAQTFYWVCAKRLEFMMMKGKVQEIEKLRQKKILFVHIFNP